MLCTEILTKEHAIILNRLDEMEKNLFCANQEEIINFLEFIKDFADDYHHAKEEEIYFKWMLEKNPNLKLGPIACMLSEHDQGRNHIKKAWEFLKSGDQEDLHREIKSFISLLTSHIEKENQVLYIMAEELNNHSMDGDEIMLPNFNKVNQELSGIASKYSTT